MKKHILKERLSIEATSNAWEGKYVLTFFETEEHYSVLLNFEYDYEPDIEDFAEPCLIKDSKTLNVWPVKSKNEAIQLFYEKVAALETLTGEKMNVKEVLI